MDPHELAQARSLALHRAVLERLERDPALLDEVRARLEAWRSDESKPQRYVEAWGRLLDGPREALRAALASDDEQARALAHLGPSEARRDEVVVNRSQLERELTPSARPRRTTRVR